MHNLNIFYLPALLMLFINAEFSNATQLEILDPDDTFAYSALLDSLFMKKPNDNDFTQVQLNKQIFLSLHYDSATISFHEMGASHTYFSFKKINVDFETFHAEAMAFNVEDKDGIWHFRCVFSADKNILDMLYLYLSIRTVQGAMNHKGDIERVQQFISMGPTENPVIRNLDDLEPAKLYDEDLVKGNANEKVFNITPAPGASITRKATRLMFRSDNFRVKQLEDIVVLNFSGFGNWFYILYFSNTTQASNFVKCITDSETIPDVLTFDIPDDLQSYIETGIEPSYAKYEPEQQSSSQQNRRAPRTLSLKWLNRQQRSYRR